MNHGAHQDNVADIARIVRESFFPRDRRVAELTEHTRVPLPRQALEMLEKLATIRASDFVFPGLKRNKPLSNMSLAMLLRRVHVDVTSHGFRSSFRDWCGDQTSFPREVAEAALAHVVGDKAEVAYRRGDALDKRRKLMDTWAAFISLQVPE